MTANFSAESPTQHMRRICSMAHISNTCNRCHKSSPGHGAKAIGSCTRIANSRASIQLTLHVPIPRYRKSTFRIPMISSFCSAPHDKKDNIVERAFEQKTTHHVEFSLASHSMVRFVFGLKKPNLTNNLHVHQSFP